MTVGRHLDEAAERLEDARRRIELLRAAAATDGERQWLDALTDFVYALSDVQVFANQSIHEKLHELGGQRGSSFERPLQPLPPGASP